VGDHDESCNNFDQTDWLESVIKLQDDYNRAARDGEAMDYDDDEEELIGEFIDYDAEPDESDDEEDDEASLIKCKPRRRIRLAWFTNYSRKLVLDGYQKL
jgi:hypothetical protein